MARTYTLRKRAESQAETRQRIVEAAVDLHGTIGPALTTMSRIAERAGIQRHTLYAHFPDERSLHLACSGHFFEREPPPDPDPWRAIADRRERLRTGLRTLYAWFEHNAQLLGCVLRDAEHHELTREMGELRFGPPLAAIGATLGEGLGPQQLALLRLALGYYTWRSLARESGLGSEGAVEAMVQAILGPTSA